MASDALLTKDSTLVKMTPALPAKCWWRLFYKRGGNPRCEMVFELAGDIQAAIRRARTYCQQMNYIFIHVEKFLHDLDADEKFHEEQESQG